MQLVATLFRTTYRRLLVAAMIGLSLSGCGDTGQSQRAAALPEVATVTLAAQPVALTTELPGRTSPFLMAQIGPQVNGLIDKRLFTEGTRVEAGQVLYEIDAAPFQAALANATAALTAARINLAYTKITAGQSLVDTLAEAHRLSAVRYDKGIDSYLSVLDAQRSLYRARQGMIGIRLVRLTNQVRLYTLLGGGAE
jgi:multidrug efflux pump subunit AcrA (membrane-fusion protein)